MAAATLLFDAARSAAARAPWQRGPLSISTSSSSSSSSLPSSSSASTTMSIRHFSETALGCRPAFPAVASELRRRRQQPPLEASIRAASSGSTISSISSSSSSSSSSSPTPPPALPSLTMSLLEIARLPVLNFSKRIVVINSLEDELRVESLFAGEKLLGFDSESRPSSALGPKNRTAIMQLASEHVACIWRVTEFSELPPFLKRVLEDPSVVKVAQGASQELAVLREEYNLNGQSFVDLHHLALNLRTSPRSLQGLVGIFLHKRLSKEQRLTDWEQKPLTKAQIDYAAVDAYASRQVLVAMRHAYGVDRLVGERLLSGLIIPSISPVVGGVSKGPNTHFLGNPTMSGGSGSSILSSPSQPPSPLAAVEKASAKRAESPREPAHHQKLVALCVAKGYVLRFDGFESAPNGFRCVFSVEVRRQGRLVVESFRSKRVHATVRAAQNDAAAEALSKLEDTIIENSEEAKAAASTTTTPTTVETSRAAAWSRADSRKPEAMVE